METSTIFQFLRRVLDFTEDQFDTKVEQYRAKWAPLFDTSSNGDWNCITNWSSNDSGGTRVGVHDEGNKRGWDANMSQGSPYGGMGHTTKSVTNIQPRQTQSLLVATRNSRFLFVG